MNTLKTLQNKALTQIKAHSILMSSLLGLCAASTHFIRISFPGSPVPLVIQPLWALLAAALLSPRYTALSYATYITLCAPTLGGIAWLFGPTAGYLWGMGICAVLISTIKNSTNTRISLPLLLCLHITLVYVPGVFWLSVLTHQSLLTSASIGTLPFLFGDLIKLSLASLAFRYHAW